MKILKKRTFNLNNTIAINNNVVFVIALEYMASGATYNYINSIFLCDMYTDKNKHPASSSGITEIIYPTFNVNNVIYNNVLLLQNSTIITYDSPQVGIIKYITKQDTFNLINYKIK